MFQFEFCVMRRTLCEVRWWRLWTGGQCSLVMSNYYGDPFSACGNMKAVELSRDPQYRSIWCLVCKCRKKSIAQVLTSYHPVNVHQRTH